MYLAPAKEASSLHVTKKCMTNSFASLGKTSLLTSHLANPTSTRAASYQRRSYVREFERLETRGPILIQGLWEIQTEAIIYLKFVDA